MTTGVLLVGHGSRVARAADEAEALAGLVRARLPAAPVAIGWLELAEPRAVDAGVRLVRAHALSRLVVQPLLLFSAYHATSDVPDVAAGIDAADPRIRVAVGGPLGLDERLVVLGAELVAGVEPDPGDDHGLLVLSSGTSDADALAQAGLAARQVSQLTGHRRVAHALAAIGGDAPARALATLATEGARTVTVLSWSLLAGRLVAAAQRQAEEAALDLGIRVRFAGRFGPDPAVADVVADRVRQVAPELR